MKMKSVSGIRYYIFPEFERYPFLVHSFSTRLGGDSKGGFSSLNLGLTVGDKKEEVIANRIKFITASGRGTLEQMVGCEQVHSNVIQTCDIENKGFGTTSIKTAIPGVDGLITSTSNLYLFALFADCVPVFLLDPVKRVVGIIHAGWRGTSKGIVLSAVSKLMGDFGSSPKNILAGIGPSIGTCCFLVGDEVVEKIRGVVSQEGKAIYKHEGNWFVDLGFANKDLLIQAGVEKIIVSNICTSCNPELFFSYRRDGVVTGRMAAMIGFKED